MQPNRPTAVLVIAILHFVFGGLGLICGLCAGAQVAGGSGMFAAPGAQGQQQQQMQEQMERQIEQRIPYYKPYQYGNTAADILLSVLMLIAGVGLLQMQAWGRYLSLFYAVLSIAIKIFTVAWSYLVLIPAMKEVMRNVFLPPGMPARDRDAFLLGMDLTFTLAPLMQLAFMIYPVVVLFLLNSASVVAAFRGEGGAPRSTDVYDPYPLTDRPEPDDRFRPS
jgi:hypothetical protein